MNFQKKLQGVIRITENGNYTLVLPSNTGTSLPNALDNQVIEHVFVIVENIVTETVQVKIILPKISDLNNAWNLKINILVKPYFATRDNYVTLCTYDEIAGTDSINLPERRTQDLNQGTFQVQIYSEDFWGTNSY